jgi:uncharacterized protein (DUF169 family)
MDVENMPITKAVMTTSKPLKPVYKEYAEHFEKLLRMSEYPLAVKMLERDEDIPELAKRPLNDFGCHLNTCQCFALSRRVGEMIAQKQEDMWRFEPALCFGLTGGNPKAYDEGLKFFLDGHTRYPGGARDLATGSKWAHSFPRFETDKYVAIVSAPLMRASFEPDLVLLYVNPAQMNQLLAGIVYEWGENVNCEIHAHGGCVNYVVPAIKTGNFWISNPCHGEFSFAANMPDKLVFSSPIEKVERLLAGMEGRLSAGRGIPINYQTEPEGWLPDSYGEIAKIMKMHRSSV